MKQNPYRGSYFKTIVCDIDDTLSISTTHDWQNAEPMWQTINKLNKLYDQGWTIILMTARGQISCNGDFERADEKYREGMEAWLSRHGVKYHMLSFEKYLAAYYVDDKSMTPEQFHTLDIRTIQTGWSGAIVEKRGDRIYKTHHDSLNAAKWYNMASPLVNVPIVHNVIGNTIALQYLNETGNRFKISELNQIIDTFSMYKTYVPFSQYIERMKSHCETNNMFWGIIPLLQRNQHQFNKHNTFCHGDMSLQNLIQTDKGLYLIDPIWNESNWSSYLLDISKMLHSYRKYNRMFEYEVFINTWIKKEVGAYYGLLVLLQASQFVRVVKYVKNEEEKQRMIDIANQLIEKCKQMMGVQHVRKDIET